MGPLDIATGDDGGDGRTYETLEGFGAGVAGASHLDSLPAAARAYTDRILHELGASYALISTGVSRDSTIRLELPW